MLFANDFLILAIVDSQVLGSPGPLDIKRPWYFIFEKS